MHTEPLHRTLSPLAYATLLDHIRCEAEAERRRAIQAFFQAVVFAWPRRSLLAAQRMLHPANRSPAMEAA
jgi:hypothetical protein